MKPADPVGSLTLQPNEKKHGESLLTQHNDDSYIYYMGKVEKRKYKIEKRILIVSSHKLYCMKPSGKLARESHVLDLLEVRSPEPQELELIFKAFRIYIPASEEVFMIINALRRAFESHFAEAPQELRPKMYIKNSARLEDLRDAAADVKPCRGFIATYRSLCIYRSVQPRLDVCWDLAHIHARKGDTCLRFGNFEQPISPQEIAVILETLRYNSFFKTLNLKDMRLEKDLVACVAETLRYNTSLTKLNLRGIGATRDGVVQVAEALALNKKISLSSIDISNNSLEDRGMVSFAGYLQHTTHNLTYLNVANCSLGQKAVVALGMAFGTNPRLTGALRCLSLSNNKLGMEGSRGLAEWLALPAAALSTLMLSSVGSDLALLLGGIAKGSGCLQLAGLDLSNNTMEKDSSNALLSYLRKPTATSLQRLDLTNTQLPIDSLKEILTIFSGSLIIKSNNLSSFPGAQMINSLGARISKLRMLDLTDNDLGDEGIALVAQGLSHCTSVEHLILNGNFKTAKRTAARVASIDSLIGLLRSPCPLRALEMTGGNRLQLKQDIFPLLAVLASNNTLTHLDITGHQMGNKGATALGKALQTNISLTKLKWDDNGTTLPGFTYFRIGMKANRQLCNMPMPYNDIMLCMKPNNWEGGNDKLLQVVKDVERYLQRNLTLANTTNNKPPRLYGSFLARSSTMTPGTGINPNYKDLEQWMMLRGGTDEEGENEIEGGEDEGGVRGRGGHEPEDDDYDHVDNEEEDDS